MAFKFRRAFVELTNVCNLSCSFCAVSKRPRGFMPLRFFETLAPQLKGLAGVISPHLLGEPFMHPELPGVLAAASRAGLKLNLVTNGTLLGKFGPELLREKCLAQVTLSLHALEGLPAAEREKTIRALEDFAGSRPAGLIASFRLRGNASSLFFKWAAAHLLRAFPRGEGLSARAAVRLAQGVYLNTGGLFNWRGGRAPGGKGCLGLRHHFGVLYGGEVVPCCADHDGALALGSALESPLADILNGPRAAALRNAIAGRPAIPAYCAGCGFFAPG